MRFMYKTLFLISILLCAITSQPAAQTNNEVASASLSMRPQVTHQEKARYTQEALDNGIHGTVLLSLVFQADGKMGTITPIKELPHGLTEMAIEAARKIRFKPALKNEQPVSVRMSVEFSFVMDYRNKRHQMRVIAFAFPFLKAEMVELLATAFEKYKPSTDTTDLWLVTCEKRGVRGFTKAERDELQALQTHALRLLPASKQKIVERLLKLWEEDKIEDRDLYTLSTLIFEGVGLAPMDKQARYAELHNRAVAQGLLQFAGK